MKVLSLFDGISGARLALKRANIKVDKYYSSEIDKYAIEISKNNWSDIIQLGDITNWRSWSIEKPDLIIGGSPCQGFSFAGKQLNFNDERSKLFFTFVDVLKHYKPKYFLLENVKMKKEYQKVITDLLGVEPIEINSALVSAQNRKRLYWCNWNIEQPEDKGIELKDVLLSGKKIGRMVGRKINPLTGKRDDYNKSLIAKQRIEPRTDNESGTLTTVQKDNIVIHNLYGGFNEKKCRTFKDKSPTVRTSSGGGHIPNVFEGTEDEALSTDLKTLRENTRKLTPIECERLQTYPDHYTTDYISNTQRYKALGNSFTVDVIAHILKGLIK